MSPDVVVTLDDTAAARVHGWCAGNRSTVVVEFDRDLSDPMELVSWQIQRAQGRLRARIGPRVDVPSFASLVVRLCAGPHPMPPTDSDLATRKPVRENWATGAESDEVPGCIVVTGVLSPAAEARLDGLVDNLGGDPGLAARASFAGGVLQDLRHAAVVLLVGVAQDPEIDELIGQRQRAGLPTVVDLGGNDLEPIATAPGARPRLTDAAAPLVVACGLAISPAGRSTPRWKSSSRENPAYARWRCRRCSRARTPPRCGAGERAPAGPHVIGWHLGAAASVVGYADAVAGASRRSVRAPRLASRSSVIPGRCLRRCGAMNG